jgi:predicted PhzF superfamily epimerase YddE/YHI9
MITLQVVDAFAEAPFGGNPAAVTVIDHFPADEWMQNVAREMNLSETAFLVERADGGHDLRWFTPTAEVDLCGHATLASAHALGGRRTFHTRSGALECRPAGAGLIQMDFPADPTGEVPDAPDLPGAVVDYAGRGRSDLLLAVADAGWLRRLRPDIAAVAALDARALIVTAPGDRPGIDFVSRVFCPSVGIDEDPVTGSAHCTLAGYWSGRLGRDELTGYQASARGGTVHVRAAGERVVIGGRAVTVSHVSMMVDLPAAP